ncbi:MAG: hypothetical protein II852_10650 [Bacteroidales bacterium]|nr:hypothetical protein [Bacteroidales bacterium]
MEIATKKIVGEERKIRKKVCFILEGKTDEVILAHIFKKLFPESDYNMVFSVGSGYSSVISKVRPIIDNVPEETKILVVYDSDTTNPSVVEEKMDLTKYLINYSMYKNRLGVFSFDPNIEAIFPEENIDKHKRDLDYLVKAVNDNINSIMNQKTIKQMAQFIQE